ncbi:MAG: pentapeptide repeat-containing protein [Pseudanabaenaceae cyanobacterium bins.39]|nr:pentapeptide repeat-containing protein [Pseudanabaenaceae cyanobacterium bins.39]
MQIEQCYQLLGLTSNATWEDINKAYKALARQWHPDRIPRENVQLQLQAQEKLKEINHARDSLRKASEQQVSHSSRHTQPKQDAGQGTQNYYQSRQTHQTYQYQTRYQGRYQSKQQTQQTHQTGDRQGNYTPPSPKKQPSQSTSTHHKSNFVNEPVNPAKPSKPDLTGADFRGANLREKYLEGRNLSYADLSNADLTDAFMHRINLQGAKLQNAKLFRANLFQANLQNADLRGANLIGADFSGADLRGADLTGAQVGVGDRIMVKLTNVRLEGSIMPNGKPYIS